MRVVRIFAALITGLALVGGCGSGASPAPAADPGDQLRAGIEALHAGPFHLASTAALNSVSQKAEGVADPARRAARLTQSSSAAGRATTSDVVVLGSDVFVRFGVPAVSGVPAGRWAHVDGKRLKSLRALGVGGSDDLSGAQRLADAVTSIERAGPNEVRGTAGLPDVTGKRADAPWQARFDDAGRLAWLSVTTAAAGEVPPVTTETTFSRFGEPVTVDRPPASETVEAPESLYTLFDR